MENESFSVIFCFKKGHATALTNVSSIGRISFLVVLLNICILEQNSANWHYRNEHLGVTMKCQFATRGCSYKCSNSKSLRKHHSICPKAKKKKKSKNSDKISDKDKTVQQVSTSSHEVCSQSDIMFAEITQLANRVSSIENENEKVIAENKSLRERIELLEMQQNA